VVRTDDHLLFAGTDRSNGDTLGDDGLNRDPNRETRNGKASGWEVDTSRGRGATGLPTACDLDEANLPPTGVPPSALPDGLVVLAQGLPDGTAPGADMTYYDHPGGGFVFSVGSITFGGSLVVDAALSTLVQNVIHRAGIS
jgi:hypothetical protein